MGTNTKLVQITARGAAILAFLSLFVYWTMNDSGHTGLPFYAAAYLFLAVGIIDAILSRSGAAIIYYLPYVALSFYLHFTGALMQYNDWLNSGMA